MLDNVKTILYDLWSFFGVLGLVCGFLSLIWSVTDFRFRHKGIKGLFITLLSLVICTSGISAYVYHTYTKVPDLVGKSYSSAEIIADNNNLSIGLGENELYKSDIIIKRQCIEKGELLRKNSKIYVYTTETLYTPSTSKDKILVPNVVGMEQIEATELISAKGLQFQVWWTEENNIIAEHYYIIDQSIKEGTSVEGGTLIELELSPTKPQ